MPPSGPPVSLQFAPFQTQTSQQAALAPMAPPSNGHFMYNTIQFPTSAAPSQFHPTSISVTPATPARHQAPSSPARGRKRKTTTPGRRGRKRNCAAPVIDTGLVFAQCGVGLSHPTSSDSPTPSPQPSPIGLPTEPVLAIPSATQATRASLQVPTASYSSLNGNRRPWSISNSATDIYYFCRATDSTTQPEIFPLPNEELPLMKKPRSQFLSCKLCK